jgi:hypothetical protein
VNNDSSEENMQHRLTYKDSLLALFDAKKGILNAAKGMEFTGQHLSRNADSHSYGSPEARLSVCIKSVAHFHPLTVDIIEYYHQQGVKHVYLGLLQPSKTTLHQYQEALANYTDFVSLGWFESTDVTFAPQNDGDLLLAKMLFTNTVLNHVKAVYQEDLLMVSDLDEILVSMEPTKSTIAEELAKEVAMDETCYAVASAYLLWKEAIKGNSTAARHLGERFPFRCDKTGLYEKSIAVVRNSNFLGIHEHGACRPGTGKQNLNASRVSIHHYVSLWKARLFGEGSCQPEEMVPSELALFQQKKHTSLTYEETN